MMEHGKRLARGAKNREYHKSKIIRQCPTQEMKDALIEICTACPWQAGDDADAVDEDVSNP